MRTSASIIANINVIGEQNIWKKLGAAAMDHARMPILSPPFGRLRYIVIHHPASDAIDKTLRDHIRPPFTDAPYNYWLEYPSGDLVKGRSLAKKGAHVVPDYTWAKHVNNSTAIGVAFEGNFDDEKPPFEPSGRQIERGAALIGQLCAEWNVHPHDSQEALRLGQGIVPHCVVSRTACPGRHFLVHWRRLIGKIRYYYNLEKE